PVDAVLFGVYLLMNAVGRQQRGRRFRQTCSLRPVDCTHVRQIKVQPKPSIVAVSIGLSTREALARPSSWMRNAQIMPGTTPNPSTRGGGELAAIGTADMACSILLAMDIVNHDAGARCRHCHPLFVSKRAPSIFVAAHPMLAH